MNKLFLCFILLFLAVPFCSSAAIRINEIAWMGTAVSANDEWIELFNDGGEDIDLTGWALVAEDGTPDILIKDCPKSCIVGTGSFFLLERTDDESAVGVVAGLIYTGALSNIGENLVLKNSMGVVIDSVLAIDGWPAGDNVARLTMQKNNNDWITAEATPSSAFFYEDSVEPSPVYTPSSVTSSNNEPTSVKNIKNIKVFAGGDRTIIAGASEEFKGMATGLEDDILKNARFLWNFGDGFLGEGSNVTHFYYHPGEYVVSLDVSSGEYSASDRILVKVIPNKITISELRPGINSFIELANVSGKEINLSYWKFTSENGSFTFAKNTFIASYGYLTVPVFSSGIIFTDDGGLVSLFYSSGLLADEFYYRGYLAENQSFSKGDSGVFITLATPGEKNSPAIKTPVVVKPVVVAAQSPAVYQNEQDQEMVLSEGENTDDKNSGLALSGVSLSEMGNSANVLVVSGEKSSGGNIYFLFLFLLLAAVGLAVFFIRRKSRI